jgi:hypothetical protein
LRSTAAEATASGAVGTSSDDDGSGVTGLILGQALGRVQAGSVRTAASDGSEAATGDDSRASLDDSADGSKGIGQDRHVCEQRTIGQEG